VSGTDATLPLALTAACALSVLVLLGADRRGMAAGRVLAKLAASTAFVGVALSLGALHSRYGQLVLGALLLGWLGDALLLSRASRAFLGGLAAFLLSHGLYLAAFAPAAASAASVAAGSALAAVGVGALVLRWLLPHTPVGFRAPVLAYVVVILAMCVGAAGHAAATGHAAVLAGALMFAASDIAVARERFVRPGFINRLWGWPAYFAAQLVLAWTVASAVQPAAVVA
jgi:uncharacterized membrane protein YhhN